MACAMSVCTWVVLMDSVLGGIKLGRGHVGGEESRRNLREKGVDMIKVQCIHV